MNPATNAQRAQLAQPKITPMYPGIHQADEAQEGPNLPKAPLNTLLGFDLETYQIPLDTLMPSKRIPDGVMSTRKYKQVVSSCLLYTSPSPRDGATSRMPSSA